MTEHSLKVPLILFQVAELGRTLRQYDVQLAIPTLSEPMLLAYNLLHVITLIVLLRDADDNGK